ncbi:velvet factor-domain-containing protein [Podospora fimiseda]|uniref:Velvet factor-domain-containing protein n=1 Tax=Podospora fimiseda TaxID=252190 RepID=A0AAN7C032_9PEZI|nr:velvet factor-domain-containing protein [Podospora fimiseda]
MSAVVELAPHDFGYANMARPPHHGYHEGGYVPRHGHYAQEAPFPSQYQQQQQQQQQSPLPRLPPMSTMMSTPGPIHSPSLPNGREPQYPGARGSSYFSDYATPSPIGQTPPQFPGTNNDPHGLSRRAVDLRRSPALSSTASDRSSDEMAYEMRMRQQQMNTFHHQPQPRPPYPQQHSPHPRGDHYHYDNALPPVSMGGRPSPSPYSPAGIPSSRSSIPRLPQSPPSTQSSASPRQEPKSMSISNLLSTESASAVNNNPPPPPPPPPSHGYHPNSKAPMQPLAPARPLSSPPSTSEYHITVRQQPFAARSCGFGERDRRVIDPPPIVQLTISDSSLSQEELGRRLRHQFSVVHCSIWDELGTKDMSSMPEDFRQQRRLMGTLVASPFVGQDENGEEGCFFCFPDLSCRTPGVFRLKFALVVLDPLRMGMGEKSPIVATGMSEAFQVYNAKDFPGMQASTPLTKRLKEQGCLISIKKGNEGQGMKRGGSKGNRIEEEDEDSEDEGEGVRVRKRVRRAL